MTPCSSASNIDFEHVFFSGFDLLIFQSIIFRLRWIQIPFIYIKDFLEVKYFHEVAYTAPCLLFFFFWFFFQNFQTGLCKHYFFRTSFLNYSEVIFQGKSPLSLVPGRLSLGGSFLEIVVQGGIIQEQMFGGKSPGVSCPGEKFMRVNCPGVIAQGSNIQ